MYHVKPAVELFSARKNTNTPTYILCLKVIQTVLGVQNNVYIDTIILYIISIYDNKLK